MNQYLAEITMLGNMPIDNESPIRLGNREKFVNCGSEHFHFDQGASKERVLNSLKHPF